MRLARAGRTGAALAVGGVLLTAASWGLLAVTSGTATAVAVLPGATTTGGSQSCQPLQATASPSVSPTVSPSPSPSPTPTPTPTAAPTVTVTETQTETVTASPPATDTTTSATTTAALDTAAGRAVVLMADIAGARSVSDAAAQGAAQPAATTPAATTGTTTGPVNLCVEVTPLQTSGAPGTPVQWSVAAWAVGGDVPDATLRLEATPASAGLALFSFGCAGGNGTSACDLGTVDAGSAQRQFQAQVTVPLTAAITSVSLAATGSAAGLITAPQASAPVSISASAGATASLPTGLLSGTATASPGGSAASLFPTVAPSSTPGATDGASQVASTSALSPSGHLIVQVAGLVALFAAFILAVTRVSIRRPVPPAALPPGGAVAPPPPPTPPPPGSPPPGPGTDEPTQELGGIGEPARQSGEMSSANWLRTLSARGRRGQAPPGARHKRT